MGTELLKQSPLCRTHCFYNKYTLLPAHSTNEERSDLLHTTYPRDLVLLFKLIRPWIVTI